MLLLNCVIIDDEISAVKGLRKIIEHHSGNRLNILGEAYGVKEGEALIRSYPELQLVFLDIRMRDGSGFDLLNRIKELDVDVVFVTSYDQYAIQAFEFSAIGYLLKPISIQSLREFLDRYEQKKIKLKARQSLLLEKINNPRNNRIVLKHNKGFDIIDLADIVFIEGMRNYSEFTLVNGNKVLMSKTLKYYDELLSTNDFYRVHQSYLVNLNHVVGFHNADGGYIKMDNGAHITISKSKKSEFTAMLGLL